MKKTHEDISRKVLGALIHLSNGTVIVPDSGHGTSKLKWSNVGLRAIVEATRLPEAAVRGCLEGLRDHKVVFLMRVRDGKTQVQLN